ncbi:MAG: tRNA pseudouridine(55) synthase TruB [bacterium]|nr:tRNA pseudouridine(55) synthase TruB [bacterium]
MSSKQGFLILDKPSGLTSQKALYKVRRALGLRKAGHTGTLDPLATGVLPIALGSATKAIPFLDESKKIYEVKGQLGVSTDTYDMDGKIIGKGDWRQVEVRDLEALLEKFIGPILQNPPVYSAIKVKGKALYRYARQGKKVKVPPRKVLVEEIRLLDWCGPYFTLKIVCSRGTYVRSLIHDLGKELKVGATVVALRRLVTGPFSLAQALSLEEVLEQEPEDLERKLVPLEECLSHWPRFSLADDVEYRRVCNGVPLYRISQAIASGGLQGSQVALSYRQRVVALIAVAPDGSFRYSRVLDTIH